MLEVGKSTNIQRHPQTFLPRALDLLAELTTDPGARSKSGLSSNLEPPTSNF